jgi:hypothetical protein
MTPITLLTKSNSIRGMTDRPSGYRMTKLALPKFGNARAATLRVEMEAPQESALIPVQVEARRVEPEPAATRATELFPSSPTPTDLEVATPAVAVVPALDIPIVTEKYVPPHSEPVVAPPAPIFRPSAAKERRSWFKSWNLSRLWKRVNLSKVKKARAKAIFAAPVEMAAPVAEMPVAPVTKIQSAPEGRPSGSSLPAFAATAETTTKSRRMADAQPLPASSPAVVKAKEDVWGVLLRRITFRRRAVKVRGVQTELALEKVSVIRNDLSDADLEVVPRMEAKKIGSNPFRGGRGARRAKEAKEETNAEPALVPLHGAPAGKPTD